MSTQLLKKIFGSRNDRLIKTIRKTVEKINGLEPEMHALSDDQLRQKTELFKTRLIAGESLDSVLPAAFAVVREASRRTLGLRHFDVQMIGGIVLHSGKIAEMRTGEGKTLVATLAAYLNALTGKGVHIVTVNDYLAKRDAQWMAPIYEFLGLSVGVIISTMTPLERKAAYAADVVYGTNNEFGFDYVLDNMAFRLEDRVQRALHYAIVDEVDSILIDEARTPLIISGRAEQSSDLYIRMNKIAPKLVRQTEKDGPGDYFVDEKTRQVFLSEAGHERVETLLLEEGLLTEGSSLYDVSNIVLMHHLYAALRAHSLFTRDVDYIVRDGEIMIVDEHTGRLMPGRRWSEGLHQALEAKEGVEIKSENQTLASITFQNYFRLYEKLSGMTGTADTEAFEFAQIYGLEVVVIPTNQKIQRKDLGDQIYLTAAVKYKAIINDIKNRVAKNQPVLVGTTSIETSEYLSSLLEKEGISHQVLNAKFHEKEAIIIAEAGRPGSVTLATNMAGRGTDIVLGGNLQAELAAFEGDNEGKEAHKEEWKRRHDEVIAAGGLHVLGTERNESRRIDNQLRGRSGRQGDPGSSQYFLSLEDNLMRIFAPERIGKLMRTLGMQEDEVIENPLITKTIENAQRKVEGNNFDIRKQLLDFDDVANDQRKVIYQQRNELMESEDVSETINRVRKDVINAVIDEFISPQSLEEQWDIQGLEKALSTEFGLKINVHKWLDEDEALHEEVLRDKILVALSEAYQKKEEKVGSELMRQLEKSIMLQSLDAHWKDHLATMDQLRKGIHLRGYAQKNPKQEYKREAFILFQQLLSETKRDIIATLSVIEVQPQSDDAAVAEEQRLKSSIVGNMEYSHAQASGIAALSKAAGEAKNIAGTPGLKKQEKVGRNDPCPCGSGKKYKQCHGML
ncbi:MAG: secA [Gammaproteobacteria bacterium]|nr:secA [Gammaproteobacteria bacterium]